MKDPFELGNLSVPKFFLNELVKWKDQEFGPFDPKKNKWSVEVYDDEQVRYLISRENPLDPNKRIRQWVKPKNLESLDSSPGVSK